MTEQQRDRLIDLEGRQVSVALSDGSRLDNCEVVSAGRHPVESVWLFVDGADIFVSLDDVVDVWEQPSRSTTKVR